MTPEREAVPAPPPDEDDRTPAPVIPDEERRRILADLLVEEFGE